MNRKLIQFHLLVINMLWKHSFFMFYSQGFFFQLPRGGHTASRICQNRWSRKQTNRVDPQARNQGTKTGGAGNRAIFLGSGEWFLWNEMDVYVCMHACVCVCVVALIYWCSCFPCCFLNFARFLFHVYIDFWQDFLTIVRLQWNKTVNLWMISQKIIVFITLITHTGQYLYHPIPYRIPDVLTNLGV